MTFNRDYWVELDVPGVSGHPNVTAEDISNFTIVDGMLYFYRGLNVILAVPTGNILFFGGKDRVRK